MIKKIRGKGIRKGKKKHTMINDIMIALYFRFAPGKYKAYFRAIAKLMMINATITAVSMKIILCKCKMIDKARNGEMTTRNMDEDSLILFAKNLPALLLPANKINGGSHS